ncbi:fumarylacetoacetate hydrolase family protein [Alteromonas sp. ASW11-36]|uniref:Fumarylacetoacetate hydrolase family protein n=1 Tax=Alteromonas arenosi TaxID=3055817 RepID=A0ABT7SVR7_9ALTE|nr:fumarylacetoacetate hydrolase family protein [Alteromonas sp. ASW11-36]MDM7860292.1 fumarylacetoacetate hydrolase family protein [Alteromonas sp. ASW11-36]
MSYQHKWHHGALVEHKPGKVVCVGRNYAEHARELGNDIPGEPVLFIKPATALQSFERGVCLRHRDEPYHYELEIALLIGEKTAHLASDSNLSAVIGMGLGLDLTLRATQAKLKAAGHPWERAKAFDGSCPMTPFVPIEELNGDWMQVFSLAINGELRQYGNPHDMLFGYAELLREIQKNFTLLPGDVVLTGTPKGVGEIDNGDNLILRLGKHMSYASNVIIE